MTNEVQQDEEYGFERKYKRQCNECGTHYRSKQPIEHDCDCGGKLEKEVEDD
jgi:rRNA maturation endonuclease Nob1